MKKKVLAMVLAATMIMATLAGCGGNTAASSDDGGSSSSASGDKIKLTIQYNGQTPEEKETADTNVAEGTALKGDQLFDIAFNEGMAKDYPNYEVEYVDWGWAETLDQKQRALIAAGSAPDLIVGETFIPTYAMEGILEPLPQDIVDSVYPSMLVYDKDDKPVAVAQWSSTFLLFYNKTLIEQCGYTEEDVQNMTWDEWKAISDDITAQGNGEFWGGGVPSFPHAGGSLRATPFLRMKGTDFGKDGVENLSDPVVQETLQFIREMNYNLPEGIGNGTDESPMWTMFKEGTLAFVVNGCYQVSDQVGVEYEWGYTNLPVPEEGADGNCLVGSVYLAVAKDAPNKEASFNVIRESLKPEILKNIISMRAVGVKEIVDDPTYWQDVPGVNMIMPTLEKGNYSGVAVFEKNSSTTWDILHQNVLARTTMTEDPIDVICSEAQDMIKALGE